jgi:hypothetical protein
VSIRAHRSMNERNNRTSRTNRSTRPGRGIGLAGVGRRGVAVHRRRVGFGGSLRRTLAPMTASAETRPVLPSRASGRLPPTSRSNTDARAPPPRFRRPPHVASGSARPSPLPSGVAPARPAVALRPGVCRRLASGGPRPDRGGPARRSGP